MWCLAGLELSGLDGLPSPGEMGAGHHCILGKVIPECKPRIQDFEGHFEAVALVFLASELNTNICVIGKSLLKIP